MEYSDWVSLAALFLAILSSLYVWRQDRKGRAALLKFRMDIGRSYSSERKANGGLRIVEERPPTTRLLIRNMSARPSAILRIQARNPKGSVLLDVDGNGVGSKLPMKIEPWGVVMIENTWPPGEHTDHMYFNVSDIDGKEHKVTDESRNLRLNIGDDPLENIDIEQKYQKKKGVHWEAARTDA